MKNTIFLISLMLAIKVLYGQKEISKEILFSIPVGEEMMYGESRFMIGCDAKQHCIVTRSQGQFFSYQNGIKTGTYTSLNNALQLCNTITEKNTDYSIVVNQNLIADSRFCIADENGLWWIKFNGAKIGPYKEIMGLFVSPNKQNYHALVRNPDLSQFMISNSHEPIPIEGSLASMYMSSTGKSFMVCTTNGLDMMTEMIKLNELGLSDQEYQKKLTELTQQIATQTAAPELMVYLSNGQKFGGYNKEQINSGSPAFCVTGDEHWFMIFNNNLYIDGKQTEDFKENWIALSDVWVFHDGKKYAYKTYEKLIFNDGKSFEYPLFLDYCENGNSLSWLLLENKTSLIKYSLKLK